MSAACLLQGTCLFRNDVYCSSCQTCSVWYVQTWLLGDHWWTAVATLCYKTALQDHGAVVLFSLSVIFHWWQAILTWQLCLKVAGESFSLYIWVLVCECFICQCMRFGMGIAYFGIHRLGTVTFKLCTQCFFLFFFIIIIMDICKVPALWLKVLNKRT